MTSTPERTISKRMSMPAVQDEHPLVAKALRSRLNVLHWRLRHAVDVCGLTADWVAKKIPEALVDDAFFTLVDDASRAGFAALDLRTDVPMSVRLDHVLGAAQALTRLGFSVDRMVAAYLAAAPKGRLPASIATPDGNSLVTPSEQLRAATNALLADSRWLIAQIDTDRVATDEDVKKTGSERMRRTRALRRLGFSRHVVHLHENDVDALKALGLVSGQQPSADEITAGLDSFLQVALLTVEAPDNDRPASDGQIRDPWGTWRIERWLTRLTDLWAGYRA